jgi:hypothetical protein
MCNAEEIWCRTASEEEKRCRAELDNHKSIRSANVLGSSNGRSSGNSNDVGGSSSNSSSKSGSKGYYD